jgi:HD-GYP domain-containing protein (c-di-GMP phosphodiesterase class II)
MSDIFSVKIPDSKMTREVTQLIRDTESELLFSHSIRVYFWGALAGKRKGLIFDPELLYVAAMFHDLGLTSIFREPATLRSGWRECRPRFPARPSHLRGGRG